MDNTININLAGMLFHIDAKAYDILRDYLQAVDIRLRKTDGGNEAIEDIESRIAEIFNTQKGIDGTITIENVQSMIATIGTPEDIGQGDEDTTEAIFVKRKRLYRNPDDTIIAGICGGIGAYLNIDPVIIRIVFAAFMLFFGTGFFIYLILWIIILPANSEQRRRELYGNEYGKVHKGYYINSGAGIAVREMFGAAQGVLYTIVRVASIIAGTVFVMAGFALLFFCLFVFNTPGAFLSGSFEMPEVNLSDLIWFAVTPSLYKWIMILGLVVILLPLMALVYWGIKMIFWFRAKDGILSLSLFFVWIVSSAALGLLLFNEGIPFAEQSSAYERMPALTAADTIYIAGRNKIADIKTDNMNVFRVDEYYMLMDNDRRELHVSPVLAVRSAGGNNKEGITVEKSAHGGNKMVAFNRAQDIEYDCYVSGDTIYIDDYFTIGSGNRWTGEMINISVYVAEGKVVKVDESVSRLMNLRRRGGMTSYSVDENGYRSWIVTDNGLEPYTDVK